MNKPITGFSKKRIDYNNNWPNKIIIFPAQEDFDSTLNEKGLKSILIPIKLPYIDDTQFQKLLSFKIDIFEQLPYRPDIAFDLAWRTFEAYSSYFAIVGGWSTTKAWRILNKTSEDVLINQLVSNQNLDKAFENLIKSTPLQATEFLVKRLFETASLSLKSQQSQIVERVVDCLGQDFFDDFKQKYGILTPSNQRKAGMLLQIMLSGEKIEIGGRKYQFGKLQVIKLLINGLLYTYRNERFHGDAFSSFKSSKTQLKTYAHSYFCLISTYFFLVQLIYQHFQSDFNINAVVDSLNNNTMRYNVVFAECRKK